MVTLNSVTFYNQNELNQNPNISLKLVDKRVLYNKGCKQEFYCLLYSIVLRTILLLTLEIRVRTYMIL